MKTYNFYYLWIGLFMATIAMLCPQTIYAAGATSAEINNAIVLDGSIPLSWVNDATYPWTVSDNKVRSNNNGAKNSSSKLSFSYSSDVPTTLEFKTYNSADEYSYNHRHYVYIDGKSQSLSYPSSGGTSGGKPYYVNEISIRLPKGSHTVEIKDSIGNSAVDVWTSLYDVKVSSPERATDKAINQYIVQDGSIPLTWGNDIDFPWYINADGKLESNNYGFANSASEVSFSYNTTKPTEVKFSYQNPDYDIYYHYSQVYGDDNYSQSQNSQYNIVSPVYRLPIGNHTITVRDTILNSTDYKYKTLLWNVKVTEIPDLETVILKQGSKPLVFQNNDENSPWYIINGVARSSNTDKANSTSTIKTSFTITEPSKISFDSRVGYSSSDNNHMLGCYVNGKQYFWNRGTTSWSNYYFVLEPGTYTLEWRYNSSTTGSNYWGEIKDVSLTDNWIAVTTTPGMLGVETLYQVDRLQDVEMLRISGTINSDDWKVIDQMTNLIALDLSGVSLTEIPKDKFKDVTRLKYVKLPKNLEIINENAFYNCNLSSIEIPASVTQINGSAFRSNSLRYVQFENGSRLTTINEFAFASNSFAEIILPNTIESIGNNAFAACTSLREIVIPEAVSIINNETFYNTTSLEHITLPQHLTTIGKSAFNNANLKTLTLPNTLTSIGEKAFYSCAIDSVVIPDKVSYLGSYAFQKNTPLHTVELPSGLSGYSYTFDECPNISTVICRAATPPSINGDPFRSISKSNATLKVPSFALANYKLDSYWYQFGNIIEGDPVDYWKVIGDLKLLNNRRMEGRPDIDLYYGGKLTIGGNAPMEVGKLDIYTSEGSPSSIVSDCNAFSADEINTIFKVNANKWYFITPMADMDLRQVNVSGTANYVFRYYDGATRADIGAGTSWKNVSDMTLKAGVGYIFQCNAASDITFPVAVDLRSKVLSTNAVTLPLTAHPSDNAANKGWNYVGNPYPSYYDIYYMDFTAPITVWTGSTYRAYSITDDNFVLRPMQGFFVQKPDAVDAITLKVAGRQIESTVNRQSSAKVLSRVANDNIRAIFNIEIGGEETADMTRVVLNENAELGYEIERDASKFMSLDDSVAQIYTLDQDKNKLAINERPSENGIIDLGIYIPNSNDEYTINASRMDGNAVLIDKENNIEHDLAAGGYRFTSLNDGINEGRFALRLKSDVISGISGISGGEVIIESTANGIIVKGADSISIYTTDGNQLYGNDCANEEVHIALAQGIYIAVANGKSYKVAVK